MDIDYPAVLDFFDRSKAQGLMTVLCNQGRWDKSNVVFKDGKLVKYDKRNVTPEMDYIDYGVGILRRAALDEMPDDRPVDLAELYTRMVDERRMVGYEVTNRFYEIGTPAALDEARAYLAKPN
jgi:NDP-sugar pyrophosphorylase family protein